MAKGPANKDAPTGQDVSEAWGVTSDIQGQSPDPSLGKVPLHLTHKSKSFTLTPDWSLSPKLSQAGSSHTHHLPATPLQASM